MFTGLITSVGTVTSIACNNSTCLLQIKTNFSDLVLGESIAVDGACLSVASIDNDSVEFVLSSETLSLTRFAQIQLHEQVNLERALTMADRLGGHFVTGHIDQSVRLVACDYLDGCCSMRFAGVLPEHMPYLQSKGSIAVNGVSLTINRLCEDGFEVMLIPDTLKKTTLSKITVGDTCHVEFDMLVKTVIRQLHISAEDVAGGLV